MPRISAEWAGVAGVFVSVQPCRRALWRYSIPDLKSAGCLGILGVGLAFGSVWFAQWHAPRVLIRAVSDRELARMDPRGRVYVGGDVGMSVWITPSTAYMMQLNPRLARPGVEGGVTAACGYPFPFAARTWTGRQLAPRGGPSDTIVVGATLGSTKMGVELPRYWIPSSVRWGRCVGSLLAYLLPVFIVYVVLRVLTRSYMFAKHGRCLRCGYCMGSFGRCSECGLEIGSAG